MLYKTIASRDYLLMKFKKYEQNQGYLFPPFLEDLIDENHICRFISNIVDGIDLDTLSKNFKASGNNKGGNLPYHPGMMLKVLIYAYTSKVYSCRDIEKSLEENVVFMWLSGMQKPDFRTINRFRGIYLIDILPLVFTEVIQVLSEKKIIDLNTVFIDGTKLKADANKHKMVYKKNVERFKAGILARVKELLSEIELINDADLERYKELSLPSSDSIKSLSSEELKELSDTIKEVLSVDGRSSKTEAGKQLRKTARQLKEDSEKMKKYENQTEVLDGRNSYSKTDTDASLLKMKNEELAPGYNMQAMANNGFILHYYLGQNANDGTLLKPFLTDFEEKFNMLPSLLSADAGYGNEENYSYLCEKKIEPLVLYPGIYAEKSTAEKYDFHYSKFNYDKENDVFICPAGEQLVYKETTDQYMKSGYRIEKREYQCTNCEKCKNRAKCLKGDSNRSLSVSFKLRKFQKKIRDALDTEEGKSTYKRRGHEIETVFGAIKRNMKFRRFNLRSLEKANVEIGLISLGYNLRKINMLLKKKLIEIVKILLNFLKKSVKISQIWIQYDESEGILLICC